jgi:hypothetical protein
MIRWVMENTLRHKNDTMHKIHFDWHLSHDSHCILDPMHRVLAPSLSKSSTHKIVVIATRSRTSLQR